MRSVCLVVLLSGCATTVDPNYALQIDAYRQSVLAQYETEAARARIEEARFAAIQNIAANGDSNTRNMGILVLAMSGRAGGDIKNINVNLPQVPESQEQKAYKWTALLAGFVVPFAQTYFGYRSQVSSNNTQRDIAIASYGAIAGVANNGFMATQGIATAGFGAVGSSNAASLSAISGMRPSIFNIGGDGVIGSGSFVGPNSGTNSGNSGRINSPNDNHQTVPGATDGSGGG